MKKNITISIGVVVLIIISLSLIIFFKDNQSQESVILEKTYVISRKYIALRYKTDEVLIQARGYPNYTSWDTEISSIISDWKKIEQDAVILEKLALEISDKKISFHIVNVAMAYNKQEISDIFDNAPAGKKIATLAKHLGTDAQRAYKILQQDQNQVTADAWNDAGDTFKKLEVSAIVIKDSCKIAGFVGGTIITGGVSTAVVGSTLANTTAIISGADLVLEVTEDAATIALGDNNKISTITNSVRKITEPISTLLTIKDIPNNLKTGYEKFSSVMVAVDQFKGAAQDGKIIGIELPAATKNMSKFENIKKYKDPIYITNITPDEIDSWLKEQDLTSDDIKNINVKKILGLNENSSKELGENTQNIISDGDSSESTTPITELKNNTTNLTIVSPEGKSFVPQSGLSFAVAVNNPEAIMTDGRNVSVWCKWTFYLDNVLYIEKLNPSVIHAGTKNVCEYSTLIIKQKGKLRVDFNLEKSTRSKYSDEKNIQIIDKAQREYIIN